jgi:signal transduction histidine kinase
VTQYALTSVALPEGSSPAAWRLLGSNDRGQTWTVLDVQTNQQFRILQRRPFAVRNRTAYSLYRFQIDRASWADSATDGRPSIRSDVELAELELIGPLVEGHAEATVQSIIMASEEHPVTGLPQNAFDGDPETRWRGGGVRKPGGCWIQCEYALESHTVATNLSQLTALARRAGSRDRLSQKGPRILTALEAKSGGIPRILAGYALISANNLPERDPRTWRLLGSNDDGKTWGLLDERRDELFSRRFERRVFAVTNRTAYTLYRWEIEAVRQQGYSLQIAELEPLFAKTEQESACTLVVEGFGEHPPLETADQAFDGEPKTKWLSSTLAGVTNWLQWQCVPAEEGLPVVRRGELDRLAEAQFRARWLDDSGSGVTRILSGYALTAANDYPDRDPRVWRLLGSNDGGTTWNVLDVRTNEVFERRFERREYRLGHPAAYSRFRLQIDEVADPKTANSVQLAELEALYAPADGGRLSGLVVSAKGANGYWESVDRAFDGSRDTKWLDYADESTRYSSWVEWQYVTNTPTPVVNLDRLLQARVPGPQTLSASLEGVVVSWDPQSGDLGFLDSTGFQPLAISTNAMQISILPQASSANHPETSLDRVGGEQPTAPAPHAIRAGARLRVSGQVQFDGERPRIVRPRLEVAGWLADRGANAPGAALDSRPDLVMGVIEGQARTASQGRDYTTLRLADAGTGTSWEAQVLNPDSLRLPSWLDCPVRVRGVVQPLLDEHGRLGPGYIWVAGPADVSFDLVGDQQPGPPERMTNGPIADPEQALTTRPRENHPVRLRGIITYIDMGLDEFYLQSGADSFRVHGQINAGLFPHLGQEGAYVELQGMVRDGGLYCTEAVKWLGRGKLPQPRRHSWDYLMTGKDDDQWVELEGVAGAMQNQRLTLRVGGNPVIVWVNELARELYQSLPGSLVRVGGICSPVFNDRGQRLGLRLLTPSSECFEVVSAVPKDPLALPPVPIGRILSGQTGTSNQTARMVRTSGVVTCRAQHLLFLQNGEDGLSVAGRAEVEARIGDEVEVAGVAQADGFSVRLVEALVRRIGPGQLPAPRTVGLLTSEAANQGARHDATRVLIEAVLLARNTTESAHVLTLQQGGARQTFSAFISLRDKAAAGLPLGARLRAVGVLKAKCDTAPDFDQSVSAFELYIDSTTDITVLQRPSWWTAWHTLWALGGAGGVLALALAWVVLLRRQVGQRTRELYNKIEDHKRAEKQLEAEIAERKRMEIQVEKTHKEMLIVTRQAGMAEVATSVLHNVGNVLNSINVSTALLADNLKKSRAGGNLAKAAALLRDHQNDLAGFFTSDSRGRLIPDYLDNLARRLAEEQAAALREISELGNNVEHVNEIIAMQQTHARAVGCAEKVKATELVEDALRVNADASAQAGATIEREYADDLPEITVDKHKVLHILINLIRNAEHACEASGRPEKRVSVRASHSEGRLRIAVADNGVGIATENLTRIFNHGFTTRKDGHGFGLHSGALAARELGGSLTAHSDGPGRGATFVLELPAAPSAGDNKEGEHHEHSS